MQLQGIDAASPALPMDWGIDESLSAMHILRRYNFPTLHCLFSMSVQGRQAL